MESYPKCFESKDSYEAWVSCNAQDVLDGDARFSFCQYCTVKYQDEMIKQNRCENPTFDIEECQIEDEYQEKLF